MLLIYIVIWAYVILSGLSAVLALAWTIRSGQFRNLKRAAVTIFDRDEAVGKPTDKALAQGGAAQTERQSPQLASDEAQRDRQLRQRIDDSCRAVVGAYYLSAVFWLIAGSLLALLASVKMHEPEFLANAAWLTFGRVRPAHLNTMIYGWASMAGVGTMLWLQARLCRVQLPMPKLLMSGAILWNLTVLYGSVAILAGYGTSVEWLEFPVETSAMFAALIGVLIVASLRMVWIRRVEHIYVSQWYLFGAIIWFPFLYVMAQFLIHLSGVGGVAQQAANWWFAHNVLGLWLTPIGLAAAYYLIPKVVGGPIHSYYLSMLGFWTLALFYNWAGTHHLIGGPLPAWVVTVGIVGSVMMFIPVITVAINHHLTTVSHFRKLVYSPTLRFTVFGAMCYTAVSVQGSLTALRNVNETTHFTHYTVAHAHLGVYAFFTMLMFAAFYYVMPRIMKREWASPWLIKAHFWSTGVGIAAYWIALTWGGVLQGMQLNDSDIPFLDIVAAMEPYLIARSLSGVLLTLGHVAFAVLVGWMFFGKTRPGEGPTLFTGPPKAPERAAPQPQAGEQGAPS